MPNARMTLPDTSHYYKGLLILMGKDRLVDPRERELMLQIGCVLDFDRRFCEAAIDDLLHNRYITDEPIVFSSREIAECFWLDALRLAVIDGEIHDQEMEWLKAVAGWNGLPADWMDAQMQRSSEMKGLPPAPSCFFAIQAHL